MEQRDLSLAEALARRATDTTKGKNPEILDTLARVLFMQGKKSEAVSIQEQAAALASGDKKARFQKVLESYRKGEVPSTD